MILAKWDTGAGAGALTIPRKAANCGEAVGENQGQRQPSVTLRSVLRTASGEAGWRGVRGISGGGAPLKPP